MRVLLGERDRLLAGPGVVADRGDDVEFGRKRREADLEANLVVALAGAAVGDDRAAVTRAAVDQVLDDQRPRDRRDQRVPVHVQRVAGDGRQAVLVRELVAGVDHHRLDSATIDGSLTNHLHVLAALTEVDGNCHDLLTGLFTDPADGHRGVQAARVREDYALRHEGVTPCLFVLIVKS